ncbi:MAG: DUF4124 domain-containing protein, partial [Gammaproteobacteria bacterium]|nr:DUF4124 domain-containing protein [Gammaproteobacteria bacterium]
MTFFVPVAQAGTVYKWVDEDGQVNYGRQPKSKNAEEIIIKQRKATPTYKAEQKNDEERIDKQKRFVDALNAEEESLAIEKKNKKEKEAQIQLRCNASRDQLKRAVDSGALYDLDDKGNRILLDKKQYEIAVEQAKARVEKWCK